MSQANILSLDLNKRYTYADYVTWMDDVRRELIHCISLEGKWKI